MDQFFPTLPAQPNFVELEKRLVAWWYASGLVAKYLTKNNQAAKNFVFIDGPITANNPMGVHHAWGRTLKDLYQRYKNMQGFRQRFQNGFDCQGLWVEVEVEKDKGFKSKKDIENYGIGNFVKDCKNRVLKYSNVQTEQSKRLGYFMDWENSYYTMSENNNYMIWHFLATCHKRGDIYKGSDSVPWCPRCGTSLSHHEIATEGYKELTHESVYLKFPVIRDTIEAQDEFLLVWTTTPWTIPADTLVAIHPEILYALVQTTDQGKLWLAKNLVTKILGSDTKIVRTATGQELIAKEHVTHYSAPFDSLPVIQETAASAKGRFHSVVTSKDLVSETEGTGLVHIVPGAGTEDHALVINLAQTDPLWRSVIFPVVDEAGSYLPGFAFLAGQNAKTNPKLITDYLRQTANGRYLFKTAPHTHAYPVCWRCGTELIWRVVDEWYISMGTGANSLRQKMMAVTKKITWLPSYGKARELDWLKNMHDWLISKKRYWGLALPIWECGACSHFQVIGSKEELQENAVEGWEEFDGHTPHRPWIDKVKIRCSQCGALATRIPDVGNPWLDAGIVNFSTIVSPKTGKLAYLTDKDYWHKWYPADFITEDIAGQFRNWFYSLLAMSTTLENHEPFKTVLGHGLVRDAKGQQMHKSQGNAIWFDEAAEQMGVDTMRWLFVRQNPEFNLNFGYQAADEVRRQYIYLFWNSFKFFTTYANLNSWSPPTVGTKHQALNSNEFGSWKLELGTLDRWLLSKLESAKLSVTQKLDIYNHHEAIAELEQLLEDLSLWYIRRSRDRLSPDNPNRSDQQSALGTLYYTLQQLCLLLAPFIPFLAEYIWQSLAGKSEDWSVDQSLHLANWPSVNQNLIDHNLEKTMVQVRDMVSLGHSKRKSANIKLRQPLSKFSVFNFRFSSTDEELIGLIKDELNVKQVVVKTGRGNIRVELDTTLTPALIAEGEARELIRQVQKLRQEMGLALTDKITIHAPDWPKEWEEEIKRRTGAIYITQDKALHITHKN